MENLLFQTANSVAIVVWLLMLVLPRWHWTQRVVQSQAVTLLIAALYCVAVVPILPQALPMVANPQMEVLMPALNTPRGFAALWVHVVTFDLFVGSWIYQDAQKRNYSPWLTAPFLLVTLLFGPLGFFTYNVLTWIRPNR